MAITRSDRFTLGSVLDRVDTGTFTVSRSTYTPGQFLSAHVHELACATVVMRGAVGERVGGRRFECTHDRFLVRPPRVVHENRYGRDGAECVIVGVREEWLASDRVTRDVFQAPRTGAGLAPGQVARRIRRELRVGDRGVEAVSWVGVGGWGLGSGTIWHSWCCLRALRATAGMLTTAGNRFPVASVAHPHA